MPEFSGCDLVQRFEIRNFFNLAPLAQLAEQVILNHGICEGISRVLPDKLRI